MTEILQLDINSHLPTSPTRWLSSLEWVGMHRTPISKTIKKQTKQKPSRKHRDWNCINQQYTWHKLTLFENINSVWRAYTYIYNRVLVSSDINETGWVNWIFKLRVFSWSWSCTSQDLTFGINATEGSAPLIRCPNYPTCKCFEMLTSLVDVPYLWCSLCTLYLLVRQVSYCRRLKSVVMWRLFER